MGAVIGSKYRIPAWARILALVAVMVLGGNPPIWARTWPAGIDRQLELSWPEKMPAAEAIYGRVVFEPLRLIVPQKPVVFDDSGKTVPSEMILVRGGRHELWFQASPQRKYFLGWGVAVNQPEAAKPDPATAKREKDIQKDAPRPKAKVLGAEPIRNRPVGWSATVPTVEVRPGGLYLQATWQVRDGAVANTGRRSQDFLVSRNEFGDLNFSVRVRPGTTGEFGVAVRIGDPAAPMHTGLCWQIGVAKATKQKLGTNRTFGLVEDEEDGSLLKANEWNDLRVNCEGHTVLLLLNGELCKRLELPDGSATRGAVALIADGGQASFDEVKVTDLGSHRVVLNDSFTAKTEEKSPGLKENWRVASHDAAGGFLRIINTGKSAAQYEVSARIHYAPWRAGPVALGYAPIEPQQATPWLWLETIEGATAPCTLLINPLRSGAKPAGPKAPGTGAAAKTIEDPAVGTVEFVRSLVRRDGDYVRRFRLQNEPLLVEVEQLDFRSDSDLRTPDEIGDELLDRVRKMKFAGKRPERLPTGAPSGTTADLEAGRLLGFNALSGLPNGFPAKDFQKLGFRYIFSDSHAIESRSQDFGYKTEVVGMAMGRLADEWKSLGLADKVYCVNLFEDAALDIDGQIRKVQPVNLQIDPNAWKQMMKAAGLKPSDFVVEKDPPAESANPDSAEYWQKLQAVHPSKGREDPAGASKSLRLLASIWTVRFRNATDATRRAFRRGVFTTADIHPDQYLHYGLGGIDPWTLFARQQSLDIARTRDDGVLDPIEEEFVVDLQRAAQSFTQKPVFGSFKADSGDRTRSSNSLELRAMSALGAGARGLTFSNWGPRWRAESKWYSDDMSRLETIGRINHAAGWVEEILLDGRPALGEIGILVSPQSDLWEFLLRDREHLEVTAERRRLYRLVRSLHYQVDFLNDESLPRDSEIDRYRVLVVSQPCMTVATAKRLASWVGRGGTLIASASPGQFDENCRPLAANAPARDPGAAGLLQEFGIKSLEWEKAASREIAVTPSLKLEITAPVRRIVTDKAEVIHKFSTGAPAVTRQKLGKGQLILSSFALGAAYTQGARVERELVKGVQPQVRELVKPWLSAAMPPMARTDHPLVSARLVRSYHGNALFLINLTGDRISRVAVTVRIPGIQKAESLSQGELAIDRQGGELRFELPLERTDVVRFK